MGDTGSLLLGFVIAVLCIRLLQINASAPNPILQNAPMFVLGIVMIPVFDTIRVFAKRTWKGQSPFVADKTHIHHLLTNSGFSHVFATRVICFVHAFILIEVYLLQTMWQELILLFLVSFMMLVTYMFRHSRILFRKSNKWKAFSREEYE